MNVDELYRLAVWYLAQHPQMKKLYAALLGPINHNANQAAKQPVEIQLNALIGFLQKQHFEELSIEQIKVLSALGVETYLGREGAAYVEKFVRTSNYDPATAVQNLNKASRSLEQARGAFSAYCEAVKSLGLEKLDVGNDNDLITIRVGFQNDASIGDITGWKDHAKEWYDIVRGLAMVCEQKPEDVKVVGATTGSIILMLAGTAAFTALLAKISKDITAVAKDIIGVRVAMEDLRQKNLLTKNMESEFKKLENEKKEGALGQIEAMLDGKLAGKDGEIKAALSKSIQKLLAFSEKGGSVDFVSPEEDVEGGDAGDAAYDGALRAALLEARDAIREYQGERESLKMLSDGTKNP